MTAVQKAMSAYGQATETIPPGKQIVMLYDGILRNLKAARAAIDQRRINDRYMAVQKATMIIEALQGCLDHENGGEIAPRLDQLYTYFIFRLQAINIDDDVKICDELSDRIGELRASWAEISKAEPKNAIGSVASSNTGEPGKMSAMPSAVTA